LFHITRLVIFLVLTINKVGIPFFVRWLRQEKMVAPDAIMP